MSAFAVAGGPVLLDSGPYHAASPFPFGMPGCCGLDDGTWLVGVSTFANSTDNDIDVELFHLDASFSVIGTLHLTNADTFGGFAGVRIAQAGQSAVVFVNNRNSGGATLYSWLVDCSSASPSITASSSASSEVVANVRNSQVGPPSADVSSSGYVICVGWKLPNSGGLVTFDSATGALIAEATITRNTPLAVYADPADNTKCATFDDNGDLIFWSGLPGSPTIDSTVGNAFEYEPLGAGDPYNPSGVWVDLADGDAQLTLYDYSGSGTPLDSLTESDFSFGLGAATAGSGDAAVTPVFGFGTVGHMRALCTVGHAIDANLDLAWPGSIDPNTVDSISDGSFAAAFAPAGDTAVIVGCVLDGSGLSLKTWFIVWAVSRTVGVRWHTVGGHFATVGGVTPKILTPGVGWVDVVDGPG